MGDIHVCLQVLGCYFHDMALHSACKGVCVFANTYSERQASTPKW